MRFFRGFASQTRGKLAAVRAVFAQALFEGRRANPNANCRLEDTKTPRDQVQRLLGVSYYYSISYSLSSSMSFPFMFIVLHNISFSSLCKKWHFFITGNTAVQIMQSFNWQFQVVEEGMEHTSILASIASPFAVLLIPLGFGVWQLAAAAITGFIAKENVVGTLAVVYGLTNCIDTDDATFYLIDQTRAAIILSSDENSTLKILVMPMLIN